MRDNKLVVDIAKILLKKECDNWCWAVISQILKCKYLTEAEQIYDKLVEAGWKRVI
jgi:hypothetical protein